MLLGFSLPETVGKLTGWSLVDGEAGMVESKVAMSRKEPPAASCRRSTGADVVRDYAAVRARRSMRAKGAALREVESAADRSGRASEIDACRGVVGDCIHDVS